MDNNLSSAPPLIDNGQLDLSQWDFHKNGLVDLSGNWFIAEGEKDDTPESILKYMEQGKCIETPFFLDEELKQVYNSIWVILKIKVSPQSDLGLSFIPPYTHYNLYINLKEVEEIEKNDLREQCIKLPPDGEYIIGLHLKLHEKNYYEKLSSIKIGTYNQLKSARWYDNFIDSIILGILVMMFLYHAIVWIGRKKDKAPLYFALICLVIFIYQLGINRFIRDLFPAFSIYFFELEYKLAYISLALGWLLLPLFLKNLFPEETNSRILLFLKITCIVFNLFTLFFTKDIYTRFMIVYFLILGFAGGYSVFITFLAKKRKRTGSLLICIGILGFIFTIVNDMLKGYFELKYFIYLSHFGFIFLLFMQATSIAIKFLKSYEIAEYLSANLKCEVNNQTAILNEQKKELEILNLKLLDVNKQQTIFFQNITHELRTPLTLILGPLETLRSGKGHSLTEQVKAQLTIIWRNALQLLNLINQLLDISRIDANEVKLNLEPVDIVKMLRYLKDTFSSLASKKEITFCLKTPETVLNVLIDKNKMERIIINLLINAFKFTPRGGSIQLRLNLPCPREAAALTAGGKEAFEIMVQDTGIGINEDHIPYIFNRFRQEDESTTRNYGGTGIGLSLVKEYVLLHSGNIEVKSKKGLGTTFTLSFPLITPEQSTAVKTADKPGEEEKDTGSATQVPDSELVYQTNSLIQPSALINLGIDTGLKKKILLVENNKGIRDHIIESLDNLYFIYEAVNGEEALSQLASVPVDLIITDMMMPVMDGYTFIEQVRKNELYHNIPILLTTAKPVKTGYQHTGEAEPTDFLPKPFSREQLKLKITNLLEISTNTNTSLDSEQGNTATRAAVIDDSGEEDHGIIVKHDYSKKTIFLVENNQDLVYFIKSNFYDEYNFYYALNGRNALEKLQKIEQPDLIISDIMMEEMDGITFYHELNKINFYQTIPFIFLTAKSTLNDKLEGLSTGAIDYIYKPFSIQELKLKVNSLIEKQILREMLHENDKFVMIGKLFAGLFHEIMNPLGATYATLENLEKYINTSQSYEKRKFHSYLERTFKNLARINNLIMGFRNLHSKKKMKPEVIKMDEIIDLIQEIFMHKMADIKLTTELDQDVIIKTSPELLSHVLLNLVSNAIDAITGPGEIKIITRQNAGRSEIIVSDTGAGISREYISQIFRPFFTKKANGQGLGLYIVKDILLKMNWDIEAQSIEGKGTKMILKGKE